MRFLINLGIVVLTIFLVRYLYTIPQFQPQLQEIFSAAQSLIGTIEDQLSQQSGVAGVGMGQQIVSVSVPRSQASDWQQVGEMGHQILSSVPPQLKIEVDYTANSLPPAQDLTVIRSVLGQYSNKLPAVTLDTKTIPVRSNYSLTDVTNLTKENRSCYSNSTQVCLYFLFLPGKFENSNALGAAFTSTSTVILLDQLAQAAKPIGNRDRIAQATITHEIGHLFGLVGLLHPSGLNHEDPNHLGHSSNRNSVMYWAVEDVTLQAILGFGPPVTFDTADNYDINQIKLSR